MKQLLIFLICIFCYHDNSFVIEKNSTNFSIDTAAIIKKIKSDFLAINKQLSFYKKKNRPAFGMSAEGGEVTGYYSKGALKKIHCVFYGETGRAESDYYFNNSGLFFLYKKEVFYNKPISLKGFKIKSSIETRYYLFGDKVIKTITMPNTSLVLSYSEIKVVLKQIMDILNEK